MKETYAQRQAKQKRAVSTKKRHVANAISALDRLSKIALEDSSQFTPDERREIDQARFNLQSILSGWANRGRR